MAHFDELDATELFPFRVSRLAFACLREFAFERCVVLWQVFD